MNYKVPHVMNKVPHVMNYTRGDLVSRWQSTACRAYHDDGKNNIIGKVFPRILTFGWLLILGRLRVKTKTWHLLVC